MMGKTPGPAPVMEIFIALAHRAGRTIMEHYSRAIEVRHKPDSSPVTPADEASERIILNGLAESFSDIPVVSEEAAALGRLPAVGSRFILVDPLDGTREFIKKNGEFTVNIALIENGVPAAGVIYAPALDHIAWGGPGYAAWGAGLHLFDDPRKIDWRALSPRKRNPGDELVVLTSRSRSGTRLRDYLKTLPPHRIIHKGSSLKLSLLAAGQADLYPCMGRTMEWDIAAGHAIVAAAGGEVVTEDGAPLRYGKDGQGFSNPCFIARARR